MRAPPVPERERERLRALALYRVLDTAPERTLDDLTALAATVCGTPISLIALVDRDRQWFKSRVGVDASETPRDVAFCAHALTEGDGLFIVEDASRDERFADNPYVTDEPRIRFYAGAPLIVRGEHALGTLCVIDRVPRVLDEEQRQALRVLGRAVVAQLELQRARQELKDLQSLLPMCAWCRAVRRDDDSWQPLHEYVMNAVPVTHGICPECARDAQTR